MSLQRLPCRSVSGGGDAGRDAHGKLPLESGRSVQPDRIGLHTARRALCPGTVAHTHKSLLLDARRDYGGAIVESCDSELYVIAVTSVGEIASRSLWGSTSMPLHSLPSMLARELDRPVVEKTGLTGKYDFKLQFTPAMGAAADSPGPSIFTAMEEELGLKLVPSKAALDVLVVDGAERPAEN
jgi:hypothetical protein